MYSVYVNYGAIKKMNKTLERIHKGKYRGLEGKRNKRWGGKKRVSLFNLLLPSYRDTPCYM